MKRVIGSPAVPLWLLKSCGGSCTSAPFQPDSSSSTNNKHRHRAAPGCRSAAQPAVCTRLELQSPEELTWICSGVTERERERVRELVWAGPCCKSSVSAETEMNNSTQTCFYSHKVSNKYLFVILKSCWFNPPHQIDSKCHHFSQFFLSYLNFFRKSMPIFLIREGPRYVWIKIHMSSV